jgi:hypothetical protein
MPLPTGRGTATDELGKSLVSVGLLTTDQLRCAQQEDQRKGIPFSTFVVEMGYVSEPQLAGCISETFGLPLLGKEDLEDVSRDALATVPREVAERYRLLPLRMRGNAIELCLADPQKLEELADVERAIGRPLRPFIVTETVLSDALEEHYGIRPSVRLFHEGKAPPPSRHRLQRLKKFIDRTGVFTAFSPPPEAAPGGGGHADLLAAATSSAEVLHAAVSFFVELFPEVVALGINKGQALVLLVGTRARFSAPPQRMGITLPEGSLVRSVLDRPQVAHHPTITDGTLATLCRKLGVPLAQLTLVPVFDSGRPAFVVIGQGLDEAGLKERFVAIRDFVASVSEALRRVAPPSSDRRH